MTKMKWLIAVLSAVAALFVVGEAAHAGDFKRFRVDHAEAEAPVNP